jgi:hypothetical protein
VFKLLNEIMCTAVFLGRPFTHKFDDIQRLAEWNTSNCKGSIELDAYCTENLNSSRERKNKNKSYEK